MHSAQTRHVSDAELVAYHATGGRTYVPPLPEAEVQAYLDVLAWSESVLVRRADQEHHVWDAPAALATPMTLRSAREYLRQETA